MWNPVAPRHFETIRTEQVDPNLSELRIVTSNTVTLRRSEMGVRAALGATRANISALVLRSAFLQVGCWRARFMA